MMRILIYSLVLIALTACGSQGDGAADDGEVEDSQAIVEQEVPADFATFYRAFHADSAFQVEHTMFPLAGKLERSTADSSIVQSRWEKDDWRVQRPLNLGVDFVQDLDIVDGGLIVETVRARQGNYVIQRRFAKLGDDWTLIFYRESML